MDSLKDADQENAMPVKIGVTGGVGSGKSLVCAYLKQKGLPVVSADELSRNAVMPGTPGLKKIIAAFGDAVLSPDGTLDRKKMRAMMTRDAGVKKRLEEIVHPEVFSQMDRELENARKRGAFAVALEVPLLFEAGLATFFDYILTVTVDPDVRVRRVMDRDGVTAAEARALMGIQLPEVEKTAKSHFVINNSGSPESAKHQVDRFYDELVRLAETRRRLPAGGRGADQNGSKRN